MSATQLKHASILPPPVIQQSTESDTKSDIARLIPQLKQLQIALEKLQLVQEKSHPKKQLLEITYQTVEQKRQQLQAAHQKKRAQAAVLDMGIHVTNNKQPEVQFHRAQQLENFGILTSRIVHNLNDTLSSILTISQLLRSRRPNLSEQSQEMLAMPENSAKRGANLTRQILTYSREPQREHQPTQIASLFQGALNAAHEALSDGGVLTVSAGNCCVDQASASNNPDAQGGNYVA